VLRIGRSFSNINSAGQPYVTCRTCHNQHVMTVFAASSSSPIVGNTTGYYATYFFIAAPYNPNLQGKLTAGQAASTTQFCRQCHFGEANEANNTNNIPTVFQ
jgi:nitrate/TMAO reductase-like tetraheme cytochrome c subunit